MSQVDYKSQTKVKNIALGCISLQVIGMMSAGMYSYYSKSNRQYAPRYHYQDYIRMISITMESLGLLTCILLYVGAKKKNKCLLIPFMVVMVLLQGLLFFGLLNLGIVYINGGLHIIGGIFNFFMNMIVMIGLFSITGWMLKTTRAFYNEIRDTEGPRSPPPNNYFVNTVFRPYTEEQQTLSHPTAPSNNLSDIEANNVMLEVEQTDRQVRRLNRINLPAEAPSGPTEPPPPYNETSTLPNDGVELPPSYDAAMAMKKQDPNEDHD